MMNHSRLWMLFLSFALLAIRGFADDGELEWTALYRTSLPSDSGVTDGQYRELAYSPGQWYGSTYFTGPDWTRVGKNWHHPGHKTPSVRCFVAPRDGTLNVSGRVFKLHLAGDGIRACIRHNDREIWQTEIDGDDGQGTTHNLTVEVLQGDRLRFVVHKRVAIGCDTTGWDPVLRYAGDEQVYAAAQAFEQHQQGGSGWRYEMEVGGTVTTGLPVVHTWSLTGVGESRPVRSGQPVELTQSDSVPMFVVADGPDQGGLALAAFPGEPWRFTATLNARGQVDVLLEARQPSTSGAPLRSECYTGGSANGWKRVDQWLATDRRFRAFRILRTAWADGEAPLTLRAMIQADWQRQDAIDGTTESYAAAVAKQREQAKCLRDDLRTRFGAAVAPSDLTAPDAGGDGLDRASAFRPDGSAYGSRDAAREAWLRVRSLKRRIALANPLLAQRPLLVCKRVPPSWSHEVAQYYGWRQRPGGGLYVLPQPGRSLEVRDILQGQLPPGSVLEPRLSYDARRILFAFVACSDDVPEPASLPVNETGPSDRYFHLYEINVDGSGLRQLTDGPYDDMMADYLPDGGIVFCSTRRKGYSRCFGPEYSYRWHTYTLHRMNADGSDIRTLSYNDVSEWFPAVSNSGHVLHARWDYIDRDAVTHQNLWSMRPDGSNSIAVWGNAAPKPHCSFQAKPIPNSNKIVFIAAAHHAITAGPVCVVDPAVDTNSLEAVTRITPLAFPEAEGKLDEWYSAPWPLSEDYFLVGYSPYRLRFQGEHMTDPNPDNALGVYLLDAAGNRELLYRDPDIGTTNPMPLAPRPRPPILSPPEVAAGQDTGTMLVSDVYQGLDNAPRGSIQALRIVQIFPKSTWLANQPRMGIAGEENGRAILGTVPVEPDGSAYFEVPASKPILFQALDQHGMAYQTMRSLTFVQPGEQTACVGCHEHRMSTPPPIQDIPLALQRGPSSIEPGELGGRPFGFVEMVQPILNAQCVRCHGGEQTEGQLDLTGTPLQGFTRSYVSLCGSPETWPSRGFDPALAESHWIPRFVQRNQIQNTPPGGLYGARGSRLMRLLRDGHEGVELTPRDIRRLAAWIDMNAIFYGVYDARGQARQLAGQSVAMPEIQ